MNKVRKDWLAMNRILFWSSIASIFYAYVGFPFWVAVRALVRKKRLISTGTHTPLVSIIVAAHNEAAVIAQKLDNLLQLDYPEDRLEIIIASDGSEDGTNEIVASYDAPQICLLALPRQGKNRVENTAVSQAKGTILLFTDADTMLTPDTVTHLVTPFSDPSVGGVCGEHNYTPKGNANRLFSFKRDIKQKLSDAGSTTSGEGQLYAIRRELFSPLPTTVSDDLYNTLQVPAAHARLLFEPRAMASPLSTGNGRQAVFQRKVRINTRVLQTMWTMRKLFNPFQYGFYSIQLFSHKLARRLAIFPIMLIGLTSSFLWRDGAIYKLAATVEYTLFGTAVLGIIFNNHQIGHIKPIRKSYRFLRNSFAFVAAFTSWLTGTRYDMWTHESK